MLNEVLEADRDKCLVIDADEFKRDLLREVQADGSYESWLMPETICEREAAGEKFFPLELASLVPEESSHLAKRMRAKATASGDNIVVDTVLSSEATALALGETFAAAGYDVLVIDVEVPFEVSAVRIRTRWEQAYGSALEGGDSLGGRWVPSEHARSVYERSDGRSKSEVAARRLAEQCSAVSRYQVFRTRTKRRSRRSHQRLMLICPALGMGQGLLILKRSPSQTECRATNAAAGGERRLEEVPVLRERGALDDRASLAWRKPYRGQEHRSSGATPASASLT